MKLHPFSAETSWFLVISFANAFIASLLSLNGFPDDLIFWSIQSALFAFAACIGHFTFLFLLISLPFWLAGHFLNDKRISNSLILLSNIFLLTLIYFDTRIFELYKFHLDGTVLELITSGALRDVLSFNFFSWILFSGLLIILIALEISFGIFIFRHITYSRYKTAYALLVLGIFFLSATVSQAIYIFSDAKGDITITGLKRYVLWPQTITAKGKLKDWGVEVRESNNKKLTSLSKELTYPKQPLQCAMEKPYNLLFIVVDALRFDMLNQQIMPSSWAIAQSSHHYTEHYSLSNSTRFGMFSLMYGLPGNYLEGILNSHKGSVLLEKLAENSYQFNITSSAPIFNQKPNRLTFSESKSQLKQAPNNDPSYKKDKFITQDFIEFIKSRNETKPFFSFMFYDSPRAYSYPDNFKEKFKPSWEKINYLELDKDFDASEFFNRYKNSVNYADTLLEGVFNEVKKKSLLKDTIIVFTSVHGQEFNETGRNFWGHNGNFSVYQTKVPLFIYWPENHPLHGQQQFNQQTASIDLLPTLMSNMFSCHNPVSDYSLGYDLYASQNNYARPLLFESWSQRAIMGKDYIMVSYDSGGNEYFSRSYQRKEKFTAPQEDLSAIFKQMSAFNK